jgi:hypothetical protein
MSHHFVSLLNTVITPALTGVGIGKFRRAVVLFIAGLLVDIQKRREDLI